MATSNQGGRGSNLTTEDRRRGGEHSHSGKGSSSGSSKGGRGSNLTQEDRKKGGEHSHSKSRE